MHHRNRCAATAIVAVSIMGTISMPGSAVAEEKPLVSVTVPELSQEATIGAALYNENCAKCHGQDAAGKEGVGPPFIHVIYEPNHHGDIAFQLAARQGVRAHHWRFGDMPPVSGVSEGDVEKIIAYVRELQRANGIQ